MNYFMYERISTKEQKGLQSFSRQEAAAERYEKENNIKFTLVFKEDKSGKNFTDRTEWNRLEAIVKEGDTIVFKEISRFTREIENGFTKYYELMNKGINLVFIDNPTVSTDYIKQLLNVAEQQNIVAKTALESTVKLLLIVELDRVQTERELICKRIAQGVAASTKKNGRPQKYTEIPQELKEDIERLKNDRTVTYVELMKKHNISRNTLKKYMELI